MLKFQSLFKVVSKEGKSLFSTTSKSFKNSGKPSRNNLLIAFSASATCGIGYYLAQRNTSHQVSDSKQKTLKLCITGAAGQIGYSIIPQLLSGNAFGQEVDIDLRLLDIPQADSLLRALEMEIKDSAFPNLSQVSRGSDPHELFKDADVVVFLGGMPRKPGMERKDLLKVNGDIFIAQGKALDAAAKKNVKSVVVANPANTNCLILADHAPSIKQSNFTCLSRLDHNRTISLLAEQTGVSIDQIQNIVVWGNHSTTQYPDVNHGTISGRKIKDYIKNDQFFKTDFLTKIQKRGGEILEARKNSAVSSAAVAVVHHLQDWYLGTKPDEFVSMGIYSDGSAYDIPSGIFYSMPVKCQNFEFEIVQNLPIDSFSREQMNLTRDELLAEKADFYGTQKK